MATPPHLIDWSELLTGATDAAGTLVPYCGDIAPPARLSYLAGLAHLVRAVAFAPYAAQSLTTDAAQTNGAAWTFGQIFAPGTRAAQALAVRSGDGGTTGGPPPPTTLTASQSGTTSQDVITIPSAAASGIDDSYPPPLGGAVLSEGSLTHNATPAGSIDRMLEIAPIDKATLEQIDAQDLIGLSFRAQTVLDLESI